MQINTVFIAYQSGYNGCNVCLNADTDELDMDCEDKALGAKIEELQVAVIETAGDECATKGRHEGMFMGDIDELEAFAIKRAKELFGEDVVVTFEEDQYSS